MELRSIRDLLKIVLAYAFIWLYIPHIFVFLLRKSLFISDLVRFRDGDVIKASIFSTFIFHIHNNSYYRSLFYHRCGPIIGALIGWYRSGDRYFTISKTTRIGKACFFEHPYATVLNAESIGENFFCIQCTTLGNKNDRRPTIGDNVTLGANVVIIGDVHVGNNVTIGAGSIVVKDIPDNAIAVGNPARVIKYKTE